MKQLLTAIIFFSLTLIAQGQIDCGMTWPGENLQPDTVSTFLFTNRSLKVADFQNVNPTSNFGFKTKLFDLTWGPINTFDINNFIARSLRNFAQNQIIDTLNCKIFGKDHETIVIKSKRKILLLIYLNESVQQDIFILTIHNKKQIKRSLDYLETHFL